ncbi:Animal haem peroxidase [Sinosporangium album]|uniref:Animal haem peroxidase n=1 Tax=Sinosporangium album TaxID=504805 RepID=A0A1G7TKA5_9ACTN|nr:peroxidase family protein [Sinosporangium album]SDG34940.1 Animal haem peroxidase [Sinosporangium album]
MVLERPTQSGDPSGRPSDGPPGDRGAVHRASGSVPERPLESRRRAEKPWHGRVLPFAVAALARMREDLRRHNLHDTCGAGGERSRTASPGTPAHRSYDGSGYDLDDVDMGRVGTRFDRNAPLAMTFPEPMDRLMSPNPREVADRLLTRTGFIPARSLNMLAAAWIQFQNHDWFSHGDNHEAAPLEVELAEDDPWHERPMRIRRTRPDPTAHTEDGRPPTYENTVTHWWDGSQLYGSSEERCLRLRSGEDGRLAMVGGRLPDEDAPGLSGIDLTGFSDNYWVGLSMMHTLFAREHNAICDMLRASYPSWGDERLFQTARLINTAVIAKIHTVEWTPGILDTRALRLGMNINWSGLVGARWRRGHGRLGRSDVISGILGSRHDHHGAPYSTTEEFVTCYRLHPLIRDDYPIRSHHRGGLVETVGLMPLQGLDTRGAVDKYGMADLFYSFGVMHPGAITLHNHPAVLRDLLRINGEHIDLGTVDIVRDRERGVPRYNAFRRMLGKRPVTGFGELESGDLLRDVYDGDVDRIDTMVGMYAETPPQGFGFSETAFRIFLLMASRRLKSDPFFTDLYTPETYTPEGLAWIDETGMVDVIHRHHPELAPALAGLGNAFAPWRRLS